MTTLTFFSNFLEQWFTCQLTNGRKRLNNGIWLSSSTITWWTDMQKMISFWNAWCLLARSVEMMRLLRSSHPLILSNCCKTCLDPNRKTMKWSNRSWTLSSSSSSSDQRGKSYSTRPRWCPSYLNFFPIRIQISEFWWTQSSTTCKSTTITGNKRSRQSVSKFTTLSTVRWWTIMRSNTRCTKKMTACTTCTIRINYKTHIIKKAWMTRTMASTRMMLWMAYTWRD